MDKLDDKAQKDFLAASGYRTMRKRILCSCSMKEFLQFMEERVSVDEHGNSDEEQLVQGFIQGFEEEIVDVKFNIFRLTIVVRGKSRKTYQRD